MDQRPSPPPPLIPPSALAWLRKPQFLLPIAIVAGMTVVAFGVQPGGAKGESPAAARTAAAVQSQATSIQQATSTAQARTTQTSLVTGQSTAQLPNTQSQQPGSGQNSLSGQPTGAQSPTSDVAGARGTPSATPTQAGQPDLSRQSNQCGSIQESSVALAIEQTISGVSVKATKEAAYPIEYFRCILMATGTQDAFSLSSSVSKAQSAGMTHAVLIDLWVTNAGRDFGQLTLKDAQLAAAGQVFSPLATLGGRADVVVSSGQGRNVTLVVAIKTTVGPTIGPMTLTIGAPLFGGQPTAGKYSLFLPTP